MSEKLICNICIEPIEENSLESSLVRLKCVPDKHYFCRKCILEWYHEILKKAKDGSYGDYKSRMCPLCRGDGGYLTLLKGEKYIKGIHKAKEIKKKEEKPTNIIDIESCCKYMLTKNKRCKRKKNNFESKYEGYCTQHFNLIQKKNKNNEELNDLQIDDSFEDNDYNEINNEINNNQQIKNKIEELSELEQFESGYNEVSDIFEDYEKMWNNYSNEEKMNERVKLYEIFQMLKDQIFTLLNVISCMMDDNKLAQPSENTIKFVDYQFKTLQLEERIHVLENEMIMFDCDSELIVNDIEDNNMDLNELLKDFNLENEINEGVKDEKEIIDNIDKKEESEALENLKIIFFNKPEKKKGKSKEIKILK